LTHEAVNELAAMWRDFRVKHIYSGQLPVISSP